MKSPVLPRRSGFTLIELLTVIVIIAILAAILVPVLGRTKDRSHELAAKELCAQTAVAWNQLVMDRGRFPSKELLTQWCSDAKPSGGDLVLAMDAGALAVLNWWTPKSFVPQGDARQFAPLTIDKQKIQVSTVQNPDLKRIEYYPVDAFLERSFVQKAVGLFAPWSERNVKETIDAMLASGAGSGGDDPSGEDEGGLAKAVKKESPWRVYAILDLDGDGVLVLPEDAAALANVGLDESGKAKLRGTAAAWVRTKDGKRLLSSW